MIKSTITLLYKLWNCSLFCVQKQSIAVQDYLTQLKEIKNCEISVFTEIIVLSCLIGNGFDIIFLSLLLKHFMNTRDILLRLSSNCLTKRLTGKTGLFNRIIILMCWILTTAGNRFVFLVFILSPMPCCRKREVDLQGRKGSSALYHTT